MLVKFKKLFSIVMAFLMVSQCLLLNVSAETPTNQTESMGWAYILTRFKTFDVGRGGIAKVNLFNEELIVKRNELSIKTINFPVEIVRYYSSFYNSKSTDSIYGNGWKTNYNIKLEKCDNYYKYYRDDGSSIDFELECFLDNDTALWTERHDKQGAIGDKLFVVSNNGENQIYIESQQKRYYFDEQGRVDTIELIDNASHKITVNYLQNSERISKIIDGSGKQYVFLYKNGFLSSINCLNEHGQTILVTDAKNNKKELSIEYEYDKKGNLIKVTYPDGESVNYSYSNDGLLKKITNINGNKTSFKYQKRGIVKVEEKNKEEKTLKNTFSINKKSQKQKTVIDGKYNYDISFSSMGYPIIGDEYYCPEPLDEHECIDCKENHYHDPLTYSFELTEPNEYSIISATTEEQMKVDYTVNSGFITETTNGSCEYKKEYDDVGNVLKETVSGNSTINYSYDEMGKLISEIVSISDYSNDILANYYMYDKDLLRTINRNDFSYDFYYSDFGDLIELKIGDSPYVFYNYDNGYGLPWTKQTYANGQTIDNIYNEEMRLIGISFDNGKTLSYQIEYDPNGNIKEIIDNINNVHLSYSSEGIRAVNTYNNTLLYEVRYIDTNRFDVIINGETYQYHFNESMQSDGCSSYDTQISFSDEKIATQHIKDCFGRNFQQLTDDPKSDTTITSHYEYKTNDNYSTDLIDNYFVNVSTKSTLKTYKWNYEYYNNGAIKSITDLNNQSIYYYYDNANQLTKVIDSSKNNITNYQYDKGGNILSKTVNSYDNNGKISVSTNDVFSYEHDSWFDVLTTVNGDTIRYDSVGNPVLYGDIKMEWQNGRQLKTYSNDILTVEYRYNNDGIRTQKLVFNNNGDLLSSFNYYWINGELVSQTIKSYKNGKLHDTKNIVILYSTESNDDKIFRESIGFVVNNSEKYFYIKNLFGDIIGLVNDGSIVAEFSYDATGKISVDMLKNNFDLSWNPFYYRGYNYDLETELYYLRSRYYNPNWGRFINADIFVDTGIGVMGTNMFAYCNNNPIMYTDYDGYWAKADHKNWSNNIMQGVVSNNYRTIIGEYNEKTDEQYPAYILSYQHIHFDRSGAYVEEDSRETYALSKLDLAASDWITAQSYSYDSYLQNHYEAEVPHNIGYAMHALQDISAHGNIGINDSIAQHIVPSTDPVKNSWLHADDPLYRWVSGSNMYELEIDPGVTTANYTSTGTRYRDTVIYTAFLLVAFEESIASHNPKRFFV